MRQLAIIMMGLLALGGCSVYPRRAPVTGYVFTSLHGHDNATENPISPKTSKICATGAWFPFVGAGVIATAAWGTAAVAPGVGNPAAKVSIIDQEMFGALGAYAQHCSIIHEVAGEPPPPAPGTTPAAAPAAPGAPGAAPAAPAPAAPAPGAPGAVPQPPAGKTI